MSKKRNQRELIPQYLELCGASPSGLRWKSNGLPACTRKHVAGYWVGSVAGSEVLAHRAVYLLTHGTLPRQVDHKNGNKLDNSVGNLRAISQAENQHNRKIAKGYAQNGRGRYVVSISVLGKVMYGGSFHTEEEARKRYLELKRVHHPAAEEHCYEQVNAPQRVAGAS